MVSFRVLLLYVCYRIIIMFGVFNELLTCTRCCTCI